MMLMVARLCLNASTELIWTTGAGREFQYLMAHGKKEYWYAWILACGWRNFIVWPLVWMPVDTKYSSGEMSTSLLWIRNNMMVRALALRSCKLSHFSALRMVDTLLVRW